MRIILVLGAALLTLPLVAAQPGDADVCADPTGAVDWWRDQAPRVARPPEDLARFHAAIETRLEQKAVADPVAACAFLIEALGALSAIGPGAITDHVEAAAALSPRLGDVSHRSTLLAVAQAAGREIERIAEHNTTSTPERLGVLSHAMRVYAAADLDGPLLLARMWSEAETRGWQDDLARVQGHVEEATDTERALRTGIGAPFRLARVGDLIARLDEDVAILASHGDDERSTALLAQAEDARSALRQAHAEGILRVLATAGTAAAIASAVVLLTRFSFVRLQRDVRDLETSLLGVPPR